MAKFAALPHGWFLHLGTNRLYQHAAKLTLIRTLIPQMAKADNRHLAVYSAPELEAKATADAVALSINSWVIIDASLSDEKSAPSPFELIKKLSAAKEPAILVTHRRRLKAILRVVRAAKENQRLTIVGCRPFFRNQALLIDPDDLTVDVVSIK